MKKGIIIGASIGNWVMLQCSAFLNLAQEEGYENYLSRSSSLILQLLKTQSDIINQDM